MCLVPYIKINTLPIEKSVKVKCCMAKMNTNVEFFKEKLKTHIKSLMEFFGEKIVLSIGVWLIGSTKRKGLINNNEDK